MGCVTRIGTSFAKQPRTPYVFLYEKHSGSTLVLLFLRFQLLSFGVKAVTTSKFVRVKPRPHRGSPKVREYSCT